MSEIYRECPVCGGEMIVMIEGEVTHWHCHACGFAGDDETNSR